MIRTILELKKDLDILYGNAPYDVDNKLEGHPDWARRIEQKYCSSIAALTAFVEAMSFPVEDK